MASIPDPAVVARVKVKWDRWVLVEDLTARWVDTRSGSLRRQKPRPATTQTGERVFRLSLTRGTNTGPWTLYTQNRGDQRIITVRNMVNEVLGAWVNRNMVTARTFEAFYRQFHQPLSGIRKEDVTMIIQAYKEEKKVVAELRERSERRAARKAARDAAEAAAALAVSAKASKPANLTNVPTVKREENTFRVSTNTRNETPTSTTRKPVLHPANPANFPSRSKEIGTFELPTRSLPQAAAKPGDPIKSATRSSPNVPLEENKNDPFTVTALLNDSSRQQSFVRRENAVNREGPSRKDNANDQDFSAKSVSHDISSTEMVVDAFNPSDNPKPVENFTAVPRPASRDQPSRTEPFSRRPSLGAQSIIHQPLRSQEHPETSRFSTPRKSLSGAQIEFPTNCTPPSGPRSSFIRRPDPGFLDSKRRSQSPLKERLGVIELFERLERRRDDPRPETQSDAKIGACPSLAPAERRASPYRQQTDTYRPVYASAPNSRNQEAPSRGRGGPGFAPPQFERLDGSRFGRSGSHEGHRDNVHPQNGDSRRGGFERGNTFSSRGRSGYPRNNDRDYEGDYRMGGGRDNFPR